MNSTFVAAASVVLLACGAGTSSIGSDAGADAQPDGATCPASNPPTQKVTFHFKSATTTAYVASGGARCEPFSLESAGTPLLTAPRFECGCECAFQSAHVSALTPANGSLTWSAARFEACERIEKCGATASVTTRSYPQVALAPGAYRVTFVLFDALPSGCFASPDGTFACSGGGGGGNPGTNGGICSGQHTLAVDFSLPPQCDADVDVVLP